MKLLDFVLAISLATASVTTANPIKITKRAVGTEYPFTLEDGIALVWQVGGVSDTGSDYTDGDVQELMNILGNEVPSAGTGTYFTVSGSVSGSNGGTLSGQFESSMYATSETFSDSDWIEIFDEVVDVDEAENYPGALALTLLQDGNDEGVLTLSFVS